MSAQDLTLINLRSQKKRIKDLERDVEKIKKVIGTMAQWIAQTEDGSLSFANAAQLKEKLK